MSYRKILNRFDGVAADSVLLTVVKVVTALLGLLTTKLLSTQFSLQQYGTYSQAMLLISTVTSITILGLSDAVNYFYNAADDDITKQQNIATIFGIQDVVGLSFGILICACNIPIIRYFNNEDLRVILFFVAWFPMFSNLISMLQVLFVSIGKAKLIAIRNFIVSFARLAFVAIASFVTKDVLTIFILTLVMDVLQMLYFFFSFAKYHFRIRLKNFSVHMIKPILSFSIPMAVFVFTNALCRDIDRYVISFFTDTETLAVYTNAAKVLPFDMLTASLLTILIPIVTRQIRNEKFTDAQVTLKAYLRAGYLFTWIIIVGAIVNAREMMLFLYDEKYLDGLNIFIIYLVVDMLRFANTSLILSAKGKTKMLMICSVIALGANLVLNVLAYQVFGIIGPAFTTLLVTFCLMVAMLTLGAKEIHVRLWDLFDWQEIILLFGTLLILGSVAYGFKLLLYRWTNSYLIILFLVYGVFLCSAVLLNRVRLIQCLKSINRLK